MKNLIEEFKTFIMRGNVIQLAVAVVMGVAFGDIVKSVQADIISPILGAIGGKPDFSYITLGTIRLGSFINAIISFAITAAAVFFVIVKPMNILMERMAKKNETPAGPPPATLDDVVAQLKALNESLKK
jgi:large conductance mechanosensitive channel